MPRATPNKCKLTSIMVSRLRPAARPYLVWDDYQRGLAIQIQPSGYRSYKLIYRFHNRPRWYHIGAADAIALADARKLAAELMLRVIKGEDPAAEKRAAARSRLLKLRTATLRSMPRNGTRVGDRVTPLCVVICCLCAHRHPNGHPVPPGNNRRHEDGVLSQGRLVVGPDLEPCQRLQARLPRLRAMLVAAMVEKSHMARTDSLRRCHRAGGRRKHSVDWRRHCLAAWGQDVEFSTYFSRCREPRTRSRKTQSDICRRRW